MKKIILSALLLLLLPALSMAQVCALRLSGHVHRSATHESLDGVRVQLLETAQTVVTDANGDFRFDSLCAGMYSLRITRGSFDTLVQSLSLQKNTHLDLDLPAVNNLLASVTVTTNRSGSAGGLRQELSGRELNEAKGRSLAEALSKLAGVSLLQTGSTIAKPVIHGLHGNRIVTVNNGIRQEGQQWGNEHAPEIDLFIANRLAVVKGPDELRYGSDAIGGVVLVEPRPLRNTPGYNAEFNTQYFTNNRQYIVSGIFEQQLKKAPAFTWRLQGTYKKGANVAAPRYRLNNTAMEERNFSATAAYRKEHFSSEVYYSFFSNQVGIFSGAHIGNLADLLRAINQKQPDAVHLNQQSYAIARPRQDVNHHLLRSKTILDIRNHRFNLLVAAQHNRRQEDDVVRNAPARGAQLDLSIFTFTQELNWEHPRTATRSGTVGVVAMQQDNRYSGRYLIPNFRSYAYGAYGIEKWVKDKWSIEAGARIDHKQIDTRRLQAASQVFTSYRFTFTTVASSLQAGYQVHPRLRTTGLISLSTRAPHVNELLTNGIHHGTGTFEVGDISLRPEAALQLSLQNSYTSANNVLALSLTLYRNNIRNFIYQQPKPNEPVLTIRGAFPKLVYQATDALLQGADMALTLQPTRRLSWQSRYSLLRARNQRTDDWLILMPADRFSNELTFTGAPGSKLSESYVSVELQSVLRQTRTPDDKNGPQDYQAPPPGYSLLNASLSTTVRLAKVPVTVFLTGRNLLNQSYRDYLNFFRYYTDEMGRNVGIRLRLLLQHVY